MKKHSLSLFRYNNYKAFEEKLSRMAEEGWFLESMGEYFCTFRKGDPKKQTYEITFFPEVPDFNPYTTENQEIYYEYCKSGGWTLVTANGKLQIFSATEKNPVPIENDEKLKLKNIHSSMKVRPFPTLILAVMMLILIFLISDYNLLRSLITNPERVFTPVFFFRFLFISFFSLVVIYNAMDYSLWYFSYRRALAKGISYDKKEYKGKKVAEKVFVYIMTITMIVVFIGSCFMGYWGEMFMRLGTMVATITVYPVTIALLKKTKMEREHILNAAMMITFITIFLLTGWW